MTFKACLFMLIIGVFITLMMVVAYRWDQGRSNINAAVLKMQQLGFASEQLPLKKVKGESFLYSYFLVAIGFGQRFFFAVSGGDLAERMQNFEWATNTQNTLCFTAVVCALNVLYNQQKRRGDAA
jgi:hypothetical protein